MLAAITLAQRLYGAFARFDARALFDLLSNDFVGSVSDGMPHGVGGTHRGPTEMATRVWGRIATIYDIHLEPAKYLTVDDDRVVVIGRYRGAARDGRSSVDAAFAHVITVGSGRIAALRQITDRRCRELSPAA
jgi:uncharacterized protein